MPATKRPKPVYQRGRFKLYAPPRGRPNYEIVWYDDAAKRERCSSSRQSDLEAAKAELDRRYLSDSGERFCSGCGRPFDGEESPLLLRAITDYLLENDEKAGIKATRGRLAHAIEYVALTAPAVTCAQINDKWVKGYRQWLQARPITVGKSGQTRKRSLGHIEGCVSQLAAVINSTPGQTAQFKALQAASVAASPQYRADVPMLAAMFRWCLHPSGPKIRSDKERAVYVAYRANLLSYLRASIATWARPIEIFELGPGQWMPAAGVLKLNPPGRRQTKKYRGIIPVPRQFAPYLSDAPYMTVESVRSSWDRMRPEIGLPDLRGEAASKLIRRSVSTIARRYIGEANWRQGEIMLGHVKASTSDIYALRDPANLGLALAATERIIDEIEALVPGAFLPPYRAVTALPFLLPCQLLGDCFAQPVGSVLPLAQHSRDGIERPRRKRRHALVGILHLTAHGRAATAYVFLRRDRFNPHMWYCPHSAYAVNSAYGLWRQGNG